MGMEGRVAQLNAAPQSRATSLQVCLGLYPSLMVVCQIHISPGSSSFLSIFIQPQTLT